MSIAWFWEALIRIEPTTKTTQATAMESRRPIRSPVHDAKRAPRSDPPAIEAVMPP
jgi:hypothetical protein